MGVDANVVVEVGVSVCVRACVYQRSASVNE